MGNKELLKLAAMDGIEKQLKQQGYNQAEVISGQLMPDAK